MTLDYEGGYTDAVDAEFYDDLYIQRQVNSMLAEESYVDLDDDGVDLDDPEAAYRFLDLDNY